MKNIVEACEDTNPNRVCFFLEKWVEKVGWMRLGNPSGPRIMPNLDGLRINYCPTCGAYIREIEVQNEQTD